MITGTVWGIALILVGFLATLVAIQLLLAALFPRALERSTRTLSRRPWVSVGVGAAALLLLVAIAGALGGAGAGFLAALMISVAFLAVALGLASVAQVVGARMPSPADAGRPWRTTLRGALTCALAFPLPVVGWFLLLPAAMSAGFGAWILSRFSKEPAVLHAEPEQPAWPAPAPAPVELEPAEAGA